MAEANDLHGLCSDRRGLFPFCVKSIEPARTCGEVDVACLPGSLMNVVPPVKSSGNESVEGRECASVRLLT